MYMRELLLSSLLNASSPLQLGPSIADRDSLPNSLIRKVDLKLTPPLPHLAASMEDRILISIWILLVRGKEIVRGESMEFAKSPQLQRADLAVFPRRTAVK